MYNYKYQICVKKEHSQSDMKAIPISCLSQSGMKQIKLLK